MGANPFHQNYKILTRNLTCPYSQISIQLPFFAKQISGLNRDISFVENSQNVLRASLGVHHDIPVFRVQMFAMGAQIARTTGMRLVVVSIHP